jgi:potassium efflux system protein
MIAMSQHSTPAHLLFCLRLFLCGALFLSVLNCPEGHAQAPESVAAPPPLTLEQIESKIQSLESATDQNASRNELLVLYRLARERLQNAQDSEAKANGFRQLVASAPAATERVRREIENWAPTRPSAAAMNVSEQTSLPALEQRLAEEQRQLAQWNKKLLELEQQLSLLQTRPAAARQELADARKRHEAIELELAAPTPADELPEPSTARRTALEARRWARAAQITMLEEEALSYAVRSQLYDAQRDLLRREISQAELRGEILEVLVNQVREAEAKGVQAVAERAEQAAAGKHPVIQRLAAENAALAKELAAITARLADIDAEQTAAERKANEIEQDFESAKRKLALAGLSETLGQMLRRERRELPDARLYDKLLAQRRKELAELGLAKLRIEEQALDEPQRVVDQLLEEQVEVTLSAEQREQIRNQALALLTDRQGLLERLDRSHFGALRALSDLDVTQQRVLSDAQTYAAYLDERLLWIPSLPPVGPATAGKFFSSLRWFLNPEHWLDAIWALARGIGTAPVLIIALPIPVVLLRMRRRFGRTLEELGAQVVKPISDRFEFTVKALLLTLLLAVPWPLLMALVGWALQVRQEAPDFAKAVGAGLVHTALPFFIIRSFITLCRDNGVAAAHFNWHERVRKLWRRHLSWLLVVLVPALFITFMVESQGEIVRRESLGRVAFVIAMTAVAVVFQSTLRPRGGVAEQHLAKHPRGWLSRLRFLWYPAAVAAPLALVVLALAGYYDTALQLRKECIDTLRLIVAAFIVKEVLLRWVVVARRRIAIAKAKERRAAAAAAAQTQTASAIASGEALPAALDTPEVSLATIDAQTRDLLQTLIGLSVVVGLWLIWVNVFPALAILDQVNLWQHTVEVEGQAESQPITLFDLVLAAGLILVTVGAARNLPGVLEIALLQRLSLEAGTRYAVTAVTRYAITGIGILIVFNAIGGSWSQVQWLVAALGVGLGFGLQEIFGNFVSGLIILFERPVRIGDTVTVGDVTGTVSRIRIRATTITDWDRKELVIPNKTFVTDRLINWTLSDPITRVTIKVGVAYGSDTGLTHRVLLEVAKANPLVLEEPPPAVLFLGFGESSLDFEVRIFARELADRLPLIHEMHMAIEEALRKYSIEIPFPQRDIHVRSGVFGPVTGPADGERPHRMASARPSR